MKRLFICLLIISAMALNSTVVLAADALYRMLHADEVEQFKADQDAFIIGQLIAKKGDQFLVKNLKVISGKLKDETFLLSDDFQYGWGKTELTPTVNDYCVMSLKKIGNGYKRAWGIFKATGGDYKTLKLLSDEIRYSVCNSDIAAIEWYVNSAGMENDFFFESEKAFVRRPDGEKIQIYPKQEAEPVIKIVTNNPSDMLLGVDQQETVQVKTLQSSNSNGLKIEPMCWAGIIAALVLILAIFAYKYRKIPGGNDV